MRWRSAACTMMVLLVVIRPVACQPPPPPAGHDEHPKRALSYDEKEALYREALLSLVPRGGRWTIAYRIRDRMNSGEFPVYDSAEPDHYGGAVDLPSWLAPLIVVRASGVVDGHGVLYTGPLLAKADGCEFTGPYPEGFLCAIEGALEFVICPQFPAFMERNIPVSVLYRMPRFPPLQIKVGDGLWRPSADVIGTPSTWCAVDEQLVWSAPLAVSGHPHDGSGFRMTPITSAVVGAERLITAEAYFAMRGGRPACKLPVRFQWDLEPAGDLPRKRIENEDETDPNGRAANAIRVPQGYTKGSIRFWYHEVGPDFLPASGQSFDLAKGGG